MKFSWRFQLIEDHRDDSTARNNAHLNSENMEVDNHVSSDVANGADDSNFEQSNPSTTHAVSSAESFSLSGCFEVIVCIWTFLLFVLTREGEEICALLDMMHNIDFNLTNTDLHM